MLEGIIHWIYCLPIGEAVLLALLISGGLFSLHYQSYRKKWWKPFVVVLLLAWVMAVLAHTILNREGLRSWVNMKPFQTYFTVWSGGEIELLRSAFMNVLLFYPGGMLLLMLCPRFKGRWVLTALVLTSVGIEICQHVFKLGYVELDDVLHNTLGAFLGIAAFKLYSKIPKD